MKKLLTQILAFATFIILISCSEGDEAPIAPPTLSAPVINGLFQPEGKVTVSFTSTGTFNAGNIFTAQLSDATGNFNSPTAIGTLSGINSGNIEAVLPASVANGTGYRIRVVASEPAIIGADNGSNLSITKPTIIINSFATMPTAGLTFIPGRPVTLNITTTGVFAPDNEFIVEISNGANTFGGLLGSTTGSTLTSRTVTISASAPAGSGFRFRVVSTKPAIEGAFSEPFTVVMPNISAPTFIGGSNLVAGGYLPVQINRINGNGPWLEGNQLTVQLSDANGSFANPVPIISPIATVLATDLAITTNINIPANTPAGTGYRVRAVTTNPVVISQVSAPFAIGALPTLTIEPGVPTFTKIYSGTFINFFYTVKVTRTGTFNNNTTFFCQTSFNNSTFGASELLFGGLTTTNLTELQNNGSTFVQLQSVNWGNGNRRLRIQTVGHGNVVSNELLLPVFQTGITSVVATIEGNVNNFGTNNFVAGSPSTSYVNNQIVAVGGSNASTLFGATSLRMDILINMSSENVVTGTQNARVVVQLLNSTGTIAVYNNNNVSINVSGTATGYTVTGAGPYTLTRISGTAGNTSITVGNISSVFRMQ
jgi:hypothetical protein